MLLINTKAYAEGSSEAVIELAKICADLSQEAEIILATQPTEIQKTAQFHTGIYAQHMDGNEQGAYTGSITAEALQNAGAKGTLLNHAEKKISLEAMKKAIERGKALQLQTVVCIAQISEIKSVIAYKPDYIAIEPPELIGGNISVTTASPDIIEKAVEEAQGIPVLCGAGIKTKEDVAKALSLGAKGVLVASGVIKATDKQAIIQSFIEAMKQ